MESRGAEANHFSLVAVMVYSMKTYILKRREKATPRSKCFDLGPDTG